MVKTGRKTPAPGRAILIPSTANVWVSVRGLRRGSCILCQFQIALSYEGAPETSHRFLGKLPNQGPWINSIWYFYSEIPQHVDTNFFIENDHQLLHTVFYTGIPYKTCIIIEYLKSWDTNKNRLSIFFGGGYHNASTWVHCLETLWCSASIEEKRVARNGSCYRSYLWSLNLFLFSLSFSFFVPFVCFSFWQALK